MCAMTFSDNKISRHGVELYDDGPEELSLFIDIKSLDPLPFAVDDGKLSNGL